MEAAPRTKRPKSGGEISKDEVADYIAKLGIHKISTKEGSRGVEGAPPPRVQTEDRKRKAGSKNNKFKQQQQEKKPRFEKAKEKSAEVDLRPRKAAVEVPPRSSSLPQWRSTSAPSSDTRLFKVKDRWFDTVPPAAMVRVPDGTNPPELCDQVAKLARELFRDETMAGEQFRPVYLNDLLKSGTHKDRLRAMGAVVEEDPVHSLGLLEKLIEQVSRIGGTRDVPLQAIDVLETLFRTVLLPGRTLVLFKHRPFLQLNALSSGNKLSRDRILLIWYFEEELAKVYRGFVSALYRASKDSVVKLRKRAMRATVNLLIEQPEQEITLLHNSIEKLGDPERMVASYAGVLLCYLMHKHPAMKLVVVKATEDLVFRPNTTDNALYYSVIFLNKTVLSAEESAVAERLVSIYFALFKRHLTRHTLDAQPKRLTPEVRQRLKKQHFKEMKEKKKKAELGIKEKKMPISNSDKMLSAILNGIHRAMPYTNLVDNGELTEHLNALYKTVHATKVNTAVQALLILFAATSNKYSTASRFFAAFYQKLLDPGVLHFRSPTLLFNLLYRSIKRDNSSRRKKAFYKRILQLACGSHANWACGALLLLSELNLQRTAERRQKRANERAAIKATNQAEEALISRGNAFLLDDSDDEEKFEDVKEDDDFDDRSSTTKSMTQTESSNTSNVTTASGLDLLFGEYKPRSKNPLHARADKVLQWELVTLSEHYHPSVAKFAHSVIARQPTDYKGDPIEDFTTTKFTERFVGRKIKPPKELSGVQVFSKPQIKTMTHTHNQPARDQQEVFDPLDSIDPSRPDHQYLATYKLLIRDLNVKVQPRRARKPNEEDDGLSTDDEELEQFLAELDSTHASKADKTYVVKHVPTTELESDSDLDDKDFLLADHSDDDMTWFGRNEVIE